MEMGRAGNAFLKMASSSKVRHRPCGDGGMHTQDWQHATQNCPVPYHMQWILSSVLTSTTKLSWNLKSGKKNIASGTEPYGTCQQRRRPRLDHLSPEAWAQPGQHNESWFQRKGGQRPWEGRRGKTHLYWRCQGLVHAESDPPWKDSCCFFVYLYIQPRLASNSLFSCFSLLSTRNYVCTMPELNRIFFKDHHIQPRLASNQAPKLQKNLVSKKTKPRR